MASAFDLAPLRTMHACSRREWSTIMDGAKYSGLCIPYPKDSRFICFVWAASSKEIVFRPAAGDIGDAHVERTILLPNVIGAKPLVAYSDGPYCFVGNQLIGTMGFAKTIHLAAREEAVDWCMFGRSHFLLVTNQCIRSIIIKSGRQVEVEVWPGSWLSTVTLGWLGRSLSSLSCVRTSVGHGVLCALSPDGYFLSLAAEEKKVLQTVSLSELFGSSFALCDLAVTDQVAFVAARCPQGLVVAQLGRDGSRSILPAVPCGSTVLLSAVKHTCIAVTVPEGGAPTLYVIKNDTVDPLPLDVENICAVQLHFDCLSFLMMTDSDVVERPLRLSQEDDMGGDEDETAEELIKSIDVSGTPFSRAMRARLAARPVDEVVDAACQSLESFPPIRGFVITSLTTELKRAHQLIELLQQAGFLVKKNERLLFAASTCLERLQGAIILRKLQDVYPEPFLHAMASIDDKSLGYLLDTQDLFHGLMDYMQQNVDDAAQSAALINGICAEYLDAIVEEREKGVMSAYLGRREEREQLIQNSLINEGSPSPVWFANLESAFVTLCEINERGTNDAILNKLRSFARSALRAFVGWEGFPTLRTKIIQTLWILEGRAKFAIDLAEQYEDVEVLTRMTCRLTAACQKNELRLFGHLEWSPRLRRLVLEYLLEKNHLPAFCTICDRFAVTDDIIDSMLEKHPAHRWAIDLRRGRSIVQYCEKVASENICPRGNQNFTPQNLTVNAEAHAALARLAAFAEGYPAKDMPCGPQAHIIKLHQKYLDESQRPIAYSSYLEVLNEFTRKLPTLAHKDFRSEMFSDIRELVAMIEDAELLRAPDCFTTTSSTEDALRAFWLAVVELDREQLMTIAGASEGASEHLIASIISETAFGVLSVPEIPRSAGFLDTSLDPEIRILQPALQLCVAQASLIMA